MKRVADFYYSLSDADLLELFRTGFVEAAEVLVWRYDGRPPLSEIPDDVPIAVVWAELLAGHLSLGVASADAEMVDIPIDEVTVEVTR